MVDKIKMENMIEQCKAGNRTAQKLIYESYYDRYFTLCKRYLKSDDIAKEALNKMFYQVFTNIKKVKNFSLFEGWMKQICINTCLNIIKKNNKNKFVNIEEAPIGELPKIENEGVSNLVMEEMLQMVMQLPSRMRFVFNLYVIDGYKHQEISEELNISVGTSKFHLHQARIKLQEMIKLQEEILQPKKNEDIWMKCLKN